MILTFAYECYADEDVFRFLKDDCNLPLQGFHAYGQGEVVNQVMFKKRAHVGIVDEDRGKSHHRARDQMKVVTETHEVQHLRLGDRHLIVIKPDLEGCFLRSVKRVQLASTLPDEPRELSRRLNLPDHPLHKPFRQELLTLHHESTRRKVETLTTGLESVLRKLI